METAAAAAVVEVGVIVAAFELGATAAAVCQTVQLAELAAAEIAGMTVALQVPYPLLAACHRRLQVVAVSALDCRTSILKSSEKEGRKHVL